MFLSGLDMDMSDFRATAGAASSSGSTPSASRSGLGILAGYYILGFPIYSSILLAGLFASQTLIAYPIVNWLGIARDKAVTIAVGGTVITDTLALLLLTVIVGMATGNVDEMFWWRLGISVVACIVIIVFLFPLLAHWFFKQCSDNVSQYIFVLVMVFLGAYLAQLAGLEPIIGAFLSGMALNRLIPKTSPLMNRIEFVGNAIFIPFFLIGVGMLIDYRAFFRDWESLEVAAVMIALITAAKFIAAWLTQKTFRLSTDQRTVIFGLSSGPRGRHARRRDGRIRRHPGLRRRRRADPPVERERAERHDPDDSGHLHRLDLRHAARRPQHRRKRNAQDDGDRSRGNEDHILIPVANERTVEELVWLSAMLRRPKDPNGLYALHAIDNKAEDPNGEKRARKILDTAATAAAAGDQHLQELLRYDVNISNAIVSVARERNITDIVMGMHHGLPGRAGTATGHPRGVGSRHRQNGRRRAGTEQRHDLHLQPRPAAEHHQAPPDRRARKGRAGGGIQDGCAASAAWPKTRGPESSSSPQKPRWNTSAPKAASTRPTSNSCPSTAMGRPAVARTRHRADDCLWFVMSRRDRVSYHP